jgi:hypothetical protein
LNDDGEDSFDRSTRLELEGVASAVGIGDKSASGGQSWLIDERGNWIVGFERHVPDMVVVRFLHGEKLAFWEEGEDGESGGQDLC